MQVDPEVNRLKYVQEIQRLIDQRATLEAWGIFLLSSTRFPVVELMFCPRHRLQIPVTAPPPGMNLPKGGTLALEIPNMAARAFKAHFDLTDFDLCAPSLEFRDPWTDALLAPGQMSAGLDFDQERKCYPVLLSDHPTTHKPFLCMRGIREYHEHPQHAGDEWLLYRNDMNLFSIVRMLWRVTIDLVHPQLVLSPNAIGVQFVCEVKP